MKKSIRKGLGMIDSIDLANYILMKVDKVDHLKLQKLLYYIEAWHLAYFDGESLIEDEFEAWVHGPVSRKIWKKFKGESILYDYITPKKNVRIEKNLEKLLKESQIDLINEVIEAYGDYSSFELEKYTHSETPWIVARNGIPENKQSDSIIDKELMASYYRERIEK